MSRRMLKNRYPKGVAGGAATAAPTSLPPPTGNMMPQWSGPFTTTPYSSSVQPQQRQHLSYQSSAREEARSDWNGTAQTSGWSSDMPAVPPQSWAGEPIAPPHGPPVMPGEYETMTANSKMQLASQHPGGGALYSFAGDGSRRMPGAPPPERYVRGQWQWQRVIPNEGWSPRAEGPSQSTRVDEIGHSSTTPPDEGLLYQQEHHQWRQDDEGPTTFSENSGPGVDREDCFQGGSPPEDNRWQGTQLNAVRQFPAHEQCAEPVLYEEQHQLRQQDQVEPKPYVEMATYNEWSASSTTGMNSQDIPQGFPGWQQTHHHQHIADAGFRGNEPTLMFSQYNEGADRKGETANEPDAHLAPCVEVSTSTGFIVTDASLVGDHDVGLTPPAHEVDQNYGRDAHISQKGHESASRTAAQEILAQQHHLLPKEENAAEEGLGIPMPCGAVYSSSAPSSDVLTGSHQAGSYKPPARQRTLSDRGILPVDARDHSSFRHPRHYKVADLKQHTVDSLGTGLTLLDTPDVPPVTLAPAAPPIDRPTFRTVNREESSDESAEDSRGSTTSSPPCPTPTFGGPPPLRQRELNMEEESEQDHLEESIISGISVASLEENEPLPWCTATSTPSAHPLPHNETVNATRASMHRVHEVESPEDHAELGKQQDEPETGKQDNKNLINERELCNSQNDRHELSYGESRESTLPASSSTYDEALNWNESTDDCEEDGLEMGMGDSTENSQRKKAGQYDEQDHKRVSKRKNSEEYRGAAGSSDIRDIRKRSDHYFERREDLTDRYARYLRANRRVQFRDDYYQRDERGEQLTVQRQQLGGDERRDKRRELRRDHGAEPVRGNSRVVHQHHDRHDYRGDRRCQDCTNRPASWAGKYESPSPDYWRGYAAGKEHEKRHRSAGGSDYSKYWRDYYNYCIHRGVSLGPGFSGTGSSQYSLDYHIQMYRTNAAYKRRVDAYYGLSGCTPVQHQIARSGRSLTKPRGDESLSSNTDDGWDPGMLSTDFTSLDSVPEPQELEIFSRPHPLARFCGANGLLIKLVPTRRKVRLPPPVELHSLKRLLRMDPDLRELKAFPGPLVRSDTHKKDVIDFCNEKIKSFSGDPSVPDRSSLILLWELLVLLLKQNGFVSGSDVAKLLLQDYDSLEPTTEGGGVYEVTPFEDVEGGTVVSDHTERGSMESSLALVKFRQFLLLGHKKDALKWAVKCGLWGHALFLAAKMDPQTHASIMASFTNALAMNDPLKTLHQHLTGRHPVSLTCVADGKWGDWRPHLAMILSNPSSQPEVDARNMITLGGVLFSRGYLPAAHFCYLMSQVEFGSYACKSSKLVLLGSSHQTLPFKAFASNEAIHCTEIYEYAQSLGRPGFVLPHLQVYKFLHAMRLADYGLAQKALRYCEVLAEVMIQQGGPAQLAAQTYELANRLKYCDPYFNQGEEELEELGEPPWLVALAQLVGRQKQQEEKYCSSTAQYDHTGGGYTSQEPKPVDKSLRQDYHHGEPIPAMTTFVNSGQDSFRPTSIGSFGFTSSEACLSSQQGHPSASDHAPAECTIPNPAVASVGVANSVLPDEPPIVHVERQTTSFDYYKSSPADLSRDKDADKVAV